MIYAHLKYYLEEQQRSYSIQYGYKENPRDARDKSYNR